MDSSEFLMMTSRYTPLSDRITELFYMLFAYNTVAEMEEVVVSSPGVI
jgi:hypothetical protein